MSNQKSNQPLSDIYRRAWESCLALWPILIVRFVFIILNVGALFLCLFLAFWPLIQALVKAWRDSSASSFDKFVGSINPGDFAQFVPSLSGILFAVGLALLFITWWSLLAALLDGAVYASLRDQQENGTIFSLPEFLKNGSKYMGPMLGLQMIWFLILIAFMVVLSVLAILAGLLFHALSIPWWIGILLGIPVVFGLIVLVIGFAGVAVMGGAYLMEGKGVFSALKRAFTKCVGNYGRVIWGIFLVWVIYIVFSIAFQIVMGIFEHIPFIGILFIFVEFFVSFTLSIAVWIFTPALAVAFSLEEGY